MTYTVYADVMLGCNILINMSVLILASCILHMPIRIRRILFWSFLTGITTEAEYFLMLNHNRLIHHILYAFIYIIMTFGYFGVSRNKKNLLHIAALLSAMILLYGVLACIRVPQNNIMRYRVTGISLGIFLILCIAGYISSRNPAAQNGYEIKLRYDTKTVICDGYMDSGNVLRDTGNMPVIILDYRLMKKLLNVPAYRLVERYHDTGDFDYAAFAEVCSIRMYPLPYRTINAEFAIMPAFRLSALTFLPSGTDIEHVTAGISRYQIMNSKYQVLLNESLNPNREENSND